MKWVRNENFILTFNSQGLYFIYDIQGNIIFSSKQKLEFEVSCASLWEKGFFLAGNKSSIQQF